MPLLLSVSVNTLEFRRPDDKGGRNHASQSQPSSGPAICKISLFANRAKPRRSLSDH
jgi:hypothetical protein